MFMMEDSPPCNSPCAFSGTALDRMADTIGFTKPSGALTIRIAKTKIRLGARLKAIAATIAPAKPTKTKFRSPKRLTKGPVRTPCVKAIADPKAAKVNPIRPDPQPNFAVAQNGQVAG